MSLTRRRVPAVVGILAVAAASVALVPSSAHASPGLHASSATAAPAAIPSVIPSWAKTASVVGATPGDQMVYLAIALQGQDPAGLAAYGTAASTPGNALYHHWLTQAEFEQEYAPAAGAATSVVAALKALGVTEISTDKLGLTVDLELPASLASSIFGVTFHQVMHAGQSTRVATNQPTIPAALKPFVAGISGLTQERLHLDSTTKVKSTIPPVPVTGGTDPTAYFNAKPASTYYGSNLATTLPTSPVLSGDSSTTKPYITSGYTPPQIRGAYGVDKVTQTGKGVTAGVVLFYDGPDVGADLATFSTAFGLAAPQYTDLGVGTLPVDVAAGGAPVLDPIDAAGEQTLDVEAIHQMAPDAKIVYSGAAVPEDPAIYAALIADMAGGVQVINNSYGGVGDTDTADAAVFQTSVTAPAMAMGIGIDFSSGDSADHVASDGVREADFPATSDQVTAVGGTLIEIGKNNDYEGEAYWGTYSASLVAATPTVPAHWGPFASQVGGAGGGGGLSSNYAEPTWQQGVVPASETTNSDTGVTTPGRVLPDVAMIADSTTGILVGETQLPDVGPDGKTSDAAAAYSYYRIGGTSVSSPIFTGMMALVDQALTDAVGKTTSAGFVNPTIYPFEAKKDGAFRDPQIGRTPTGSRLGSTAAQIETGCTGDANDSDLSCTSTGSGSVPVISEVRSDYTDTANDGLATVTASAIPGTPGTATPGNPVLYHLRAQGVLGTLDDLPGYDDSTGLGSPDAPQYIADFVAAAGGTVPPELPETSAPVIFLVIGGVVATGAVAIRRRRRVSAA